MIRRTWIKLYVDQVLRGTCFTELDELERFVWFGFLLLAGDSPYPGIISATDEIGYSDDQIADLLKTTPDLIKKSKKKMVKFGKVEVDDKGKIYILKWKKYQSEYQRQRYYRDKKQDELLPGVTTESAESSPSLSPSLSLSTKTFNTLWLKYPNKIGKRAAEKAFSVSVKNEKDLKDINVALEHYLASERVKKGFIQNGSMWFHNWRDWVDYTENLCDKCGGSGKVISQSGYESYCKCPAGLRRKTEGKGLN